MCFVVEELICRGQGVRLEEGEVAGRDVEADSVTDDEDVRDGPDLNVKLIDAARFKVLGRFVRETVACLQRTYVEELGAAIGEDVAQPDDPVHIAGMLEAKRWRLGLPMTVRSASRGADV